MKTLIRSERGLSLIEVMIAAGLAGAIALGITQVTLQSQKSAGKLASDAELRTYLDDLARMMGDEKVCTSAFQGVKIEDNTTSPVTEITLKMSDGTALPMGKVGSLIPGYSEWSYSSMNFEKFRPVSSSTVGNCTLNLQLRRMRDTLGAKEINQTLPLVCRLDASRKIDRCVSNAGRAGGYWEVEDITEKVDGKDIAAQILAFKGAGGFQPGIAIGGPATSIQPSIQVVDNTNQYFWKGHSEFRPGVDLPKNYVVGWGDMAIVRNDNDCVVIYQKSGTQNTSLLEVCDDAVRAKKNLSIAGALNATGNLTTADTAKICTGTHCRDLKEKTCAAGDVAWGVNDDGTMKCLNFVMDCGASNYVQGIKSDGTLDCKPLATDTYIHWNVTPWSACDGSGSWNCTGAGADKCTRSGTKTRQITPYTNHHAPNESPPTTIEDCTDKHTGYVTGYECTAWSLCGPKCSANGSRSRTCTPTGYDASAPGATAQQTQDNNCVAFCPQTCLTAGTPIEMFDGTTMPVERVDAGDLVRGFDGAPRTVVTTSHYDHQGKIYSVNGGPYFFTGNHVFKTEKGWKAVDVPLAQREHPNLPIAQMSIGDVLITERGKEPLLWLDFIESKEPVYNFDVIDDEYLANGYWVHNGLNKDLNCFIAGTRIQLADGSQIAIEDVSMGAQVAGAGGATYAVKRRTKFLHDGKKYAINGGPAFITGNHPFRTPTGWGAIEVEQARLDHPELTISELREGDTVLTASGPEKIRKIESVQSNEPVYTLEVTGAEFLANGYRVRNAMPKREKASTAR